MNYSFIEFWVLSAQYSVRLLPSAFCFLLSAFCFLLLLLRHLILRLHHSHQPLVKPANDVLQAFDAMPGLSRTRQLVRLVGKPHHYRRYLSILERAKHLFTTGAGGCARISLTQNQHQWRSHFVDVGYRRTRFEVSVFKRSPFEPAWLKLREVCRVPPGRPVGDIALRNSRRETRGVSNSPVG